jgi:hypothetical protein
MRRGFQTRDAEMACLACWMTWLATFNNMAAWRIQEGKIMAHAEFDKEVTALLVIDPYNDFISEGGKIWDRIKGIAEANQCVPHMAHVLEAAGRAGIPVFYALHRQYRPGDYES